MEYFILDGGSTDGSVEIIQKYESFLAYWISQKDEGQSAAINTGFQMAKGHYLSWLNSDDVLLPGAIYHVIEKLHADPLLGMAFAQTDVIDEKGRKIGVFEPVDYNFKDLLSMKIILPQQAAFFRKMALESVGFLRTDLDYAMDVDLFIRIGAKYNILPISDTLAQFRLSNNNKGVMAKGNWCSEYIKIIDNFFSIPEMLLRYRSLFPFAYGGAYYRGAHTYLEIDQYSQARLWLNLAAKYNHWYYLKPGWWKAQFFTLLGKPGQQAVQSILLRMRKIRLYRNETNWQVGLANLQSVDQTDSQKRDW